MSKEEHFEQENPECEKLKNYSLSGKDHLVSLTLYTSQVRFLYYIMDLQSFLGILVPIWLLRAHRKSIIYFI